MTRQSQFVLIVKDEAMLLYGSGNGICDTPAEISETLRSDCFRPVRLLLDFDDQTFEQFTLPVKKPWDRKRILNRKIHARFGVNPLARIIQISGFHFLMTGTNTKKPYEDARTFLESCGNPVSDIAFLPIETGSYLTSLFPHISNPGWCVIALQSRHLGFRHFILKDGTVIFSRILPTTQSLTTFKREVTATLAYLPRLGLRRDEFLCLIMDLVAEDVDANDFSGFAINQHLALPKPDSDYTADFMAWYAINTSPKLRIEYSPMRLDRISRYCLRAACVIAALIVLGGAAVMTGKHHTTNLSIAQTQADILEQTRLANQVAIDESSTGQKHLMKTVLAFADMASQNSATFSTIKAALADSLSPSDNIKSLTYSKDPESMSISVDGDLEKLRQQLQTRLPDRKVILQGDDVIEIQ